MGEKIEKLKEINRGTVSAIKGAANEKIDKFMEEERHGLLLLVELFLVFALVVGIYLYLDPEKNIVPFPLNIISFVFVLVVAIWLYHYTHYFRDLWKEEKIYSRLSIAKFLLLIALVIGIYLYMDKSRDLIPYPFNYLAFGLVLVLALFLHFYSDLLIKEKKQPAE